MSEKDCPQNEVLDETWNVSSSVFEEPELRVPIAQSMNGAFGAQLTPLPLAERNVTNDAGSRSRTKTFVAVAGPLFVAVSSYVTVSPMFTVAGPVLRSVVSTV